MASPLSIRWPKTQTKETRKWKTRGYANLYPSGRPKGETLRSIDTDGKTYYESGAIESVAEYRSNRRQGLYTAYHANGKIKEQGEYAGDKKHKEWKVYDEGGGLVSSTMFKAGVEVR